MTNNTPTTSGLGKPQIDVTTNEVVIMGTRIERPPTIAPSQWLKFWESVAKR